ncbi:MAG: leucine-rich repeat protein, partial [Clostridia bacterium]|nr:leucine-rich repeat protein [Clostridia bacterium]
MKKKLICFVIVLCMVFSMLPVTGLALGDRNDTPYAMTGGNIYYEVSFSGNEIIITGGDSSIKSANIPEQINGKPVTTIGSDVFRNCYGLTSVTIPSSVRVIAQSAFQNCTSLTEVTIPEGVTTIARQAFKDCNRLTSVTIPSSVTYIGDSAFSHCSGLTSVTIPSGVTYMGDSAFYHCSGLTSVTIQSGVTRISSSAFSLCSGLTSVTIPSSVTTIDSYAFFVCSSLTSLEIPLSVSSIGDYALPLGIDIYYTGTEAQWKALFNEKLTENSRIHYKNKTAPTAVSITNISRAKGAVSLNWDAIEGVDGYRIFRKAEDGNWMVIVDRQLATTYVDSTIEEGETYYYAVSSLLEGMDNGERVKVSGGITVPYTPKPVTIGSVEAENGNVTINWSAMPGADSYSVYKRVRGGIWTTVVSNTTSTNYIDSSVEPGKTYEYTVRSCVNGVYSTSYDDTAESITVPYDPVPITISDISYANGEVTLSWTGVTGMDGYRIYRKTGSGKWTTIVASTTATSYTDTTVTEGTTYSYTLRSNVGSAWSKGYDATAATITANPPADPQPVTITSISYADGAVSLAWQAQDGVDGYRIYRKTGSGKWTT